MNTSTVILWDTVQIKSVFSWKGNIIEKRGKAAFMKKKV